MVLVLEKTLESPLNCKEIKPVNPKGNQSWLFIRRTDAETETPILCSPDVKNWLIGKDSDSGKDLKAGGEGDDRGWDGWMASLTRCTWVWASSRSWWWAGKSGALQSTGSQRVRHDWETELNWCMDVRYGPQRKLSAKELMLLNYDVGEDSWESVGLQGNQNSQS